jgi:hypothetical protein
MNATCFHFRNAAGAKISGGSLGMARAIDMNEAAQQVAAMCDVAVSPSGRVFFKRNGAEVSAYLSIDAAETEAGRQAKNRWLAACAEQRKIDERAGRQWAETNSANAERLADALRACLPHLDVARRVSGGDGDIAAANARAALAKYEKDSAP